MTTRQLLPQRRACETRVLKFWKLRWHVTIGFYNDGRPGEVFVTGPKSGVDVEATARDGAIMLSLALQYGVPLGVIAGALTRNGDGTPGSLIGAVVDQLAEAKADLA